MSDAPDTTPAPAEGEVLAVHFGRSASCSSIGSVVDVLFVSGVVGTALLAALAVMLSGDAPTETGGAASAPPPPENEATPPEDADAREG